MTLLKLEKYHENIFPKSLSSINNKNSQVVHNTLHRSGIILHMLKDEEPKANYIDANYWPNDADRMADDFMIFGYNRTASFPTPLEMNQLVNGESQPQINDTQFALIGNEFFGYFPAESDELKSFTELLRTKYPHLLIILHGCINYSFGDLSILVGDPGQLLDQLNSRYNSSDQ